MLKGDRSLLKARRDSMTPVTEALFVIHHRFMMQPPKNEVLAVILTYKPELDIYEASAVGDVARVRQLLRADKSLAASWNAMGWSPLHFAAFGGNVEVVKLRISEGAGSMVNARAKTRFRNTPLQAALLSAQYATTKYLLENGADVLVRDANGFTPLHAAAESGKVELITLLLDHGAAINSRADDGSNAYTEALRFGHKEAAEFLKSKGASDGRISIDLLSPE